MLSTHSIRVYFIVFDCPSDAIHPNCKNRIFCLCPFIVCVRIVPNVEPRLAYTSASIREALYNAQFFVFSPPCLCVCVRNNLLSINSGRARAQKKINSIDGDNGRRTAAQHGKKKEFIFSPVNLCHIPDKIYSLFALAQAHATGVCVSVCVLLLPCLLCFVPARASAHLTCNVRVPCVLFVCSFYLFVSFHDTFALVDLSPH